MWEEWEEWEEYEGGLLGRPAHNTRSNTTLRVGVCGVSLSLSFSPYSHITKRRLRAARCVSESLGRFTGAVVAFFATLSDRSSPLLSALEGFPSPSVEP